MEQGQDVYYDAHVKTHQRHLLIQWLESAKSEKIRKLKDEIVIPEKRYVAPEISIEAPISIEPTEEEKKQFLEKFSGVYTPVTLPNEVNLSDATEEIHRDAAESFSSIYIGSMVQLPVQMNWDNWSANFLQSFHSRFDKLNLATLLPKNISASYGTVESKANLEARKFSNVFHHIEVPNAISLAKSVEENATAIDQISITETLPRTISAPTPIHLTESIQKNKQTIEQVIAGVVLSKDVTIPLAGSTIPTIAINKEKFTAVSVAVSVPSQVQIPGQTVEDKEAIAKKFEGVWKPTTLPQTISLTESTEENKRKAMERISEIVACPDIALPENTAAAIEIQCHLSEDKFVSVCQNIAVPETSSLPDSFGNELETLKKRMEGACISITVPEKLELPDLSKNKKTQAELVQASKVTVSVPKAVTIPGGITKINCQPISIPKVTPEDISDILSVAKSEAGKRG
jgi:hypothetical protein